MTKTIIGGAVVAGLVVLGVVGVALSYVALAPGRRASAPTPSVPVSPPPAGASTQTAENAPPGPLPAAEASTSRTDQQGFLYGRVTTDDGRTYEGRLRWGGDQEAGWGDYFNGVKDENPWVDLVAREKLPKERETFRFFGMKFAGPERQRDFGRRFMARFGDMTRIEAQGVDVKVTLKSGTVFDLKRLDASDFDDGVRVWDDRHGVMDLDSGRVRAIDLLPTPALSAAPERLYGVVRTKQGEFTGFVQWDRQETLGTDKLDGHTVEGEQSLSFDTIRAIERRTPDSSLVTLRDGGEVELFGTNDVGNGHRGVYVDDARYGRVLVSWDAFERVDFSAAGSGPGYGDFPAGRPLTGAVVTRAGNRLTGRIVYDLDESETTETFDAPSKGVDYTIPFGLVAAIVPSTPREQDGDSPVKVRLHSGEELRLEREGDLNEANNGILVFVDGASQPEYVPWADLEQIRFDRPPAMYPPLKNAR